MNTHPFRTIALTLGASLMVGALLSGALVPHWTGIRTVNLTVTPEGK